jgi:hypothetical protein
VQPVLEVEALAVFELVLRSTMQASSHSSVAGRESIGRKIGQIIGPI